MNDFLTSKEIKNLRFKKIGKNIKISRNTIFFGTKNISLGSNVRIDALSLISTANKEIRIGSYVHIGVGCYINGSYGVDISNFVGISSGTKLFTSSDTYNGEFMTNPTVPSKLTKNFCGKIILSKYVNIGSNCVILPAVKIGVGSAVGALSLINKNLEPWHFFMGIPARKLSKRNKNIIKLSKKIKKNA